MRVLICGVGSIGERHIRNLLTLGCEQIAVFRTRQQPYRTLEREFPTFSDLSHALAEFKPHVAFVTNPTALHISTALLCAEAGCHLFIEKPVAHSLAGVERLQQVLATKGKSAMVGYMMRFHPLLQKVKSWLDEGLEGTLGRPVYVRATWGEHVADWHPWEDYRTSYATRTELGGGPALTLSHELDVLVWLFGAPCRALGLANRASPLQVNCEHAVDLLLEFDSGLTANVHLDYFQRPPHRSWELVCSRGRVVFDYLAGTLRRFSTNIGSVPVEGKVVAPSEELLTVPPDFDRNHMFIEELKYFFARLESGRAPAPSIAEASESVRICSDAVNGGNPQTIAHDFNFSRV